MILLNIQILEEYKSLLIKDENCFYIPNIPEYYSSLSFYENLAYNNIDFASKKSITLIRSKDYYG